MERVKDDKKFRLLNVDLDKGEASGIALALENEHSLLVIDERKGRTRAKKLGISIIGILGVLVVAKERGLVQTLKPILTKLEKVDFRMSENLKKQILKRVGE